MDTSSLAKPVLPSLPLPSIFKPVPEAVTQPKHAQSLRSLAFWSGVLAVPAVTAIGTMLGSRRTGLVAGAIAAIGLGALRWQFDRWFTATPAYETLGTIGDLELRRYPARVEARSVVEAADIESALDRGFGRLACYVYGANAAAEDLETMTPVYTTMRDGVYSTSFVMPPQRALSSLPPPNDPRVELGEVSERSIAVFPFRGRFTRANIEHQERRFLRQLIDAGVVTKGSVSFAAYDSPVTLPVLRRNELWIEIV